MQTYSLINSRIQKLLTSIQAKDFTSKTGTLSESDKAFLRSVIQSLQDIIRSIRSIDIGSNKYDTYVVKYLRYALIFSLLTRAHQLLGHANHYCMQYMREYAPHKIRKLDTLLASRGVWATRMIPGDSLSFLAPKLSPEVREFLEFVLTHSYDRKSAWNFDTQSLSNFFDTKVLPHRISLTKKIGLWMSHIKLKRTGKGFINHKLAKDFTQLLQPGDILLTRGNWNLTNASIPGFWKHMSLYIGDGQICEAVGEGIRTISIETMLAQNDYCLALRTRFTDKKIQKAVKYAADKIGKPYDFSFNYFCDKSMVCSALATKAYLPNSQDDEGLQIALEFRAGAYTYPPNALVKKMATEFGTSDEQLFPVAFIDASEKKQESYIADIQQALNSWKRSRWSFWQR